MTHLNVKDQKEQVRKEDAQKILTKYLFQLVLSSVHEHIRNPEWYARSLLFAIKAILKYLFFMGKRDGIVEEEQPSVLISSWMQV